MSRDLSFWKTKRTAEMGNSEIYLKLSNEEYLDFVDEIPEERIIGDFKRVFSDWYEDNFYFEKGDEAFDLMVTPQFVRTDCYGMTEDNMNKIIDILYEYGCPLYDSVIDVRFDES